MASAQNDLLIIASPRTDFFDVLQRFPGSASIEVRLDRRRAQRRRASDALSDDERRRRDRRMRVVSEELQTVGWVFIPAAERDN